MKIFFALKFTFVAFVLIAFCKSSAQSQTYKNQLGFKTDNDAYLAIKQDRYYTNGLEIYFIHALKNTKTQDTNKLVKTIFGLNVGQKIFNAHSGKTSFIQRVDRPITAYLFASTYLQWLLKNETLYKAELQLGTIGPNANGQQTQEFIHQTFGFYKIDGWQFQLKNQFGVNLNLAYQKLLYRSKNKKSDFSLPLSLMLGNTFTNLSTSVLFRTGRLNPFYHSMTTQSNLSQSALSQKTKTNEFYFFVKPTLNFILYDATIQGGLFINDKGPVVYQTQPLVFMQQLGAAYQTKLWNFMFEFTFKTIEVKSNAKPHRYGTITIARNFN